MLALVLSNAFRSLRSWLPFAALALAPAIAMGTIAVRASVSEEATMQRETARAVDARARRMARAIEDAEQTGAAALREADGEALERALVHLAPPFADVVVLGSSGAIERPSAPALSLEVVTRACAELAQSYGSLAGEARAHAGARILSACPEARGPSGRWLWPLVALDRSPLDEGALLGWLRQHASALRAGERDALVEEVKRTSPGAGDGARGELERALATSSLREDRLRAALEDGLAREIVRAKVDASGIARVQGAAGFGYVRVLPDGRRAGFVTHATSLEAGLAALVGGEERATVERGATPGSRRAPEGPAALAARFELAPELAVRVTPRDPTALARRTSRLKATVFSIGLAATTFAFALAVALFAKMRAARRLGELRTDFVAAVSHELRTPVASIRMLAELLEQRKVEPDEAHEVHTTLAREARRLAETLQRLLGFGAMTRGKLASSPKRDDVSAIVLDAIATFERDHPAMPKIVREVAPSAICEVDAALLRIAVHNLLENALKYAEAGAPYVVTLAASNDAISLSVRDHGPGIAGRDQRRIFEPFERIDDRLSRATEGSGIGLSLVRYVARAHGGEATVRSSPGAGATFLIQFPMRAT